MRATRAVWLSIAGIALTAGCIPSVFPIHTEEDVVTRDQIVGRWTGTRVSQTWDFRRGDGEAYVLDFDDQRSGGGRFHVHLTEIGNELFMDLVPTDADPPRSGFHQLHFVPVHTFFRVGLTEDELSLSFLQPQWLEKNRAEFIEKLPHVQRNNNSLLLTATTAQLREFVGQHLRTPGAFTDPFVLRKAADQ